MSRTESYLVVAASAAELAADPVVARRWGEPSALPGFTVGGLAEHLAGQVFSVAKAITEPSSTDELVPLVEHYARATWVRTGRDSEANVSIRDSGEGQAAEGPEAFVARLRSSLADVVRTLPEIPAEHRVRPPAGPWSLVLDDFLLTRMMELAVHSDDLATSVDLPTPPLPDSVNDPVLALLFTLAVGRHGSAAMLRALSRTERAPTSISAF
jgi:uncharacterized protein (TIGR03083 family)